MKISTTSEQAFFWENPGLAHENTLINLNFIDSTNQCVKWMDSMNVPELGIIFNITGERDEKTILTALAKLKPIHIFLTPNRAYDQVLKDQENRNNPMSKVGKVFYTKKHFLCKIFCVQIFSFF